MSRLRILVLLFCILIPITSAIRCQCSSSAGGIQCYSNWCEVNKFQGKVGACAVVRSGAVQHFACVRVKPDSEDGCKVDKGANGELQARCWCRDEDYCNLDLADRIDEDTSNDESVEESPEEPQPPPRLAHAHGRGQSLLPPDTEEEAGEFSIEGDYVDTEPIDDRLLAATQQNRLSSQHGEHAPRPLTSTLDDLTTVEEREDERLWRLQEEQKIRELVEQRRREEEQRRRKEDESRREAEKRIELERRVEDERRREAERHRQEETRRRHEETKREEEARRAREEAERQRIAEQVRREQEERAKEDKEEEERLRRLEDEESRRRQSEREEAEILDAAKNAHELRQKEKERIRAEMLRENIRREEERMRLQRKKDEEERQKVKETEERRVAAVSPPQEQDFFNPFADDRVLKASHVHKTQQPAQNSFAERTSTYNALPSASVEQQTRERPPTTTTEVAIMKVSSYIAEVVPTTTTRSTTRSTTSTTTTTTTSTTTSTTTRRTTTTTRRTTTPRSTTTTTTTYKAKEVAKADPQLDKKVENEEKVKHPAVGSAVNIRKHSVPKTPLDSYQQTRSSSTVFSGVLGIIVLIMVSFII